MLRYSFLRYYNDAYLQICFGSCSLWQLVAKDLPHCFLEVEGWRVGRGAEEGWRVEWCGAGEERRCGGVKMDRGLEIAVNQI